VRYLQIPELEKYVNDDVSDSDGTFSKLVGSINIQNGTFSWTHRGANLQPIGGEDEKKGKRKSNARSSNDSKKSVKQTDIEAAKVQVSESIDILTFQNMNLSL
jgi:hypothetical protein